MRSLILLAVPLLAACLYAVRSRGADASPPQPPLQPPQGAGMAPWSVPFTADAPGALAASALLDAPAGKDGFVTPRDGHFFRGSTDHRIRFWGVNLCFSGCFPTHEQADAVAHRLAQFGVNAVRFHHMDNAPFPRGIFSGEKLETLSPEAMDRLDYFIAALKSRGIYADLNLHVSRWWSKSHGWPNAAKLPSYDKIVDLFHPELIDAQKSYARDLLTHVNAYTKTRYADEPAVAMIEITNEDSFFTWGGDATIAELPEPYAGMLQQRWNDWLREKYGSREKLAEAWNRGVEPAGPNLLTGKWIAEQHESAKMQIQPQGDALRVNVQRTDDTAWHLQVTHPGLKLRKGQTYTISGSVESAEPAELEISINQSRSPWSNLGLARRVHASSKPRSFRASFTCSTDEDHARVTLIVGQRPTTIVFRDLQLCTGGEQGLREAEDPTRGTVARHGADGLTESAARAADWYGFLRDTEQRYFTSMRDFLKHDLGVKSPITGTIAIGPLGAATQAEMDFVDAHDYWDHPNFPHRPWDPKDWRISNTAMVDAPADSCLRLCAARVRGRPFTVTEYNNAAPNEWQAEGIPIIATIAALQDWDAVFLFDYSGDNRFEKTSMRGYFDVEGNPLKMATLALGARLFLGGAVRPIEAQRIVPMDRATMLRTAGRYYSTLPNYARDLGGIDVNACLGSRIFLDFASDAPQDPARAAAETSAPAATTSPRPDPRITWTARGRGTYAGQFRFRDAHAAVFAGFTRANPSPIDLGPVTVEKTSSPFAVFMLLPADPKRTLEDSDRLLLAAVARGGNTGMQWDASRHTVYDHWGTEPSLIEPVQAKLRASSSGSTAAAGRAIQVAPLDAAGQVLPAIKSNADQTISIGDDPVVWYEIRISPRGH